MARSTSSYFSNAIPGLPQVAGEYVDIYQLSSTPKYALGTKYERQDGAIFRYVEFGSTGSAGYLWASAVTGITLAYAVANTCVAPASTYQMPDEVTGVYPGSIGSRYIVATVGAVTANVYAGAFLNIAHGTGRGYAYRVKLNTLTGTPATGMTRFQLYDQVQVAIDATSVVSIQGSRWNDLAHANTSQYINVAGVALAAVTTAGYFGWVQTQGLATVQMDAVGAIGQLVTVSTGTLGAATPCTVYVSNLTANNAAQTGMTLYPTVGYLTTLGGVSTQAMVSLNIE